MGFTIIKGKFKPLAGQPDGDSVRFEANDTSLFSRLEGRPVQLGTGAETLNTVQLRFEGIDAIEKAATDPLATEAKDNMKKLLGFVSATNEEPVGYIMARMTDPNGRPLSFVFAGTTTFADGSDVFLTAKELGKSVNYKQIKEGFAYPLFYNTLFAVLRNKFIKGLKSAKNNRLGYWVSDRTNLGVIVPDKASLKTISPIWPKLWRRLEEFMRNNTSLAGFSQFLADKNERIIVLPIVEERGLQDIVVVNGNSVFMTEKPENLVVNTVINR
jgi:endonuclease YncB( thermonuclease family)